MSLSLWKIDLTGSEIGGIQQREGAICSPAPLLLAGHAVIVAVHLHAEAVLQFVIMGGWSSSLSIG